MLSKIKNRNFKNFKIAAITIEITLSVALAVVVLFALLGLFSDNLSTMAANSGIHNLFNKRPSMDQADASWGKNPTATQVNVQIVADQGLTLNDYVNNAQATINKYKNRNDLTPTEIEDLAKALTVLSITNPSGPSTSGIYPSLRTQYGISIKLNSPDTNGNYAGITTVGNTTINYDSPYNTDQSDAALLKIIKTMS